MGSSLSELQNWKKGRRVINFEIGVAMVWLIVLCIGGLYTPTILYMVYKYDWMDVMSE